MFNQQMFQPVLGTVEERLAHLERTLPTLARLDEQQALYTLIEENKKAVADLQNATREKLDVVHCQLASLQKQYAKGMEAISSLELGMEQVRDSLLGNIKEVEKKHVDLGIGLSSLHNRFEQLQTQLREFKNSLASFVTHEQIQELKQGLQTQIEACNGLALSVNRSCQFLSDSNITLEKKCQDQQSQILRLWADLENNSKEHEELQKALNEKQSKEAKLLQKLHDLTASIDEIKLQSKPAVDFQRVEQEITDKLEPVKLEANIASLRSNNNTNKLAIIEKKIEQLYLMLEKLSHREA